MEGEKAFTIEEAYDDLVRCSSAEVDVVVVAISRITSLLEKRMTDENDKAGCEDERVSNIFVNLMNKHMASKQVVLHGSSLLTTLLRLKDFSSASSDTHSRSAYSRSLGDAGVCLMITRVLQEHAEDGEVVERVLLAVRSLTMASDRHREDFSSQHMSLCPCLINIMREHAQNLQNSGIFLQVSCDIIQLLSINDHTTREFGRAGGCEVIVDALQQNLQNPAVCEAALRAISNLACDNEENCERLGVAGACKVIVSCLNLHQTSLSIQEAGCIAITNCITEKSNDSNQVLFGENGACRALVLSLNLYGSLHEKSALDYCSSCCSAIFNLCDENVDNIRLLNEENAVKAILTTLLTQEDDKSHFLRAAGEDESHCEVAISCLYNLCSNGKTSCQANELEILKCLGKVLLVYGSNSLICDRGLGIISQLGDCCSDRICEVDFLVETILCALQSHKADPLVSEKVCKAFVALAKTRTKTKNSGSLCSKSTCDAILGLISTHASNVVLVQVGSEALKYLTFELGLDRAASVDFFSVDKITDLEYLLDKHSSNLTIVGNLLTVLVSLKLDNNFNLNLPEVERLWDLLVKSLNYSASSLSSSVAEMALQILIDMFGSSSLSKSLTTSFSQKNLSPRLKQACEVLDKTIQMPQTAVLSEQACAVISILIRKFPKTREIWQEKEPMTRLCAFVVNVLQVSNTAQSCEKTLETIVGLSTSSPAIKKKLGEVGCCVAVLQKFNENVADEKLAEAACVAVESLAHNNMNNRLQFTMNNAVVKESTELGLPAVTSETASASAITTASTITTATDSLPAVRETREEGKEEEEEEEEEGKNKILTTPRNGFELLLNTITMHIAIPTIVEKACLALSTLSFSNAKFVQLFGASVQMVEAIRNIFITHSTNAPVAKAVCRFLGNLCCDERMEKVDNNADIYVKAGAWAWVNTCLQFHIPREQVILDAFWALENLMIWFSPNVPIIFNSECGILEAFVASLKVHAHTAVVAEQICKTLLKFQIYGTQDQNQDSLYLRLSEAVFDALKFHVTDVSICKIGCDLVCHLCGINAKFKTHFAAVGQGSPSALSDIYLHLDLKQDKNVIDTLTLLGVRRKFAVSSTLGGSGFNAFSRSPFGSSNGTFGTTSPFGTASPFSAASPLSAAPPFNAAPPSSFGTGAFGITQTGQTAFQPLQIKESTSNGVKQLLLQNIAGMKQYDILSKSQEELRFEDYQKGVQGPGISPQAGVGGGSLATPFVASPTQPFGAKPLTNLFSVPQHSFGSLSFGSTPVWSSGSAGVMSQNKSKKGQKK